MDKIDIKNLAKVELEEKLEGLGLEAYRARQIFKWLYKSGVSYFDEMTDLSAEARGILKAKFHITRPAMLDLKRSRADGTTKYLLKLEDANTIETVFLPAFRRGTACLSSQVGCRYGCSFCATLAFGFVRNLTRSEIVDEVIFLKAKSSSPSLTNLVFMGIGEPMDNYDNVMAAIRIFNDKDAFNIGARRITVSTCGIIPGIERLKGEGLQIELSVSLHSAVDHIRSKLVPANRIYPLKDLMKACSSYIDETGRVITFEYVLIKGVNCSRDDAASLARLLKGIKCKVNTISCNAAAKGLEKPSDTDIRVFVGILKKSGVNAIHRKSRGEDIDAGCGQLRISRF